MQKKYEKSPSALVAMIPLAVLAFLLCLVIRAFGSDSIAGGSQIALLSASSICVMLSMGLYGVSWSRLEGEIIENIRSSASAIIILLLIGSIAGTWMVSGVVPTLICYGLEVLHPSWFLAACCLICAGVSLMTGSSWTTIATIGVALMGIGRALGFEEGWIAGAIISGAYFGDKLSLLSDTTVLASSTVGVPVFTHIRYMLYTTLPSMMIALAVFLGASLLHEAEPQGEVLLFTEQLRETFHITPWLLLVPLVTGLLIARKLPAIVTLFVATLLASLAFPLFQPELVKEVAGEATGEGFLQGFRGVLIAVFGATSIDAGSETVNALISTRGMSGMMNTVWLILCAMSFGGVMTGSGMLAALTNRFIRWVHRPRMAVSATVGAGLFFNLATADQYISIILTGRLFRELYRRLGLEERLLSRTVEDSATVTSVLIPWNSCGMTQATVLGVATFTYLPYCIFNYLSPIFSILVALIGYKIYRRHE
jgi:NhaC family Na+:H+ antiporter